MGGVTQKSRKGEHCYKVSSRYSIWLPRYGANKDSMKIILSKEVTQKVRKGERSFLYATRRLGLIHIAMKFHFDIPNGYRVMMHARIVGKNKLIKGQ